MPVELGIVGGGQLGRMLTPPALEMGYTVTVLDPTPDCPASLVGAHQIVGGLKDEAATRELAQGSSIITFEIEHINAMVLAQLAAEGFNVQPSPEMLRRINDKLAQKQMLRNAGIPVADFLELRDAQDAFGVETEFGYPFVLKTRRGGYDGRGNVVVNAPVDVVAALWRFGDAPLYAERMVSFEKELAVIAARSQTGDIATYPVVQTIHKDNICHTVLAPAPIEEDSITEAEDIAYNTMKLLNGAGVFGIELFLTADGRVLVNEIAPRVHNSGHFSIEACLTSQFEQHIRAVSGLPLGDPEMRVPAAVMVNILGDRTGTAQVTGLHEALRVLQTSIHIYGKKETKPQRKMGHITSTGNDLNTALMRANTARSVLSI